VNFLMPKNKKVLTFVVIAITIVFVIPFTFDLIKGEGALALNTGLEKTANAAGLPKTESIATIIGQVIYAILGFLGVVFIVLLIYGGFLRMTAQGDPNKIKQSMGIITSAVVGVIIILASYTITAFVLSSIGASVGEGGALDVIQGNIPGRFNGPEGNGGNGGSYQCRKGNTFDCPSDMCPEGQAVYCSSNCDEHDICDCICVSL